MPEVRLIDANALIKDIAESIRLADDWEKEAYEIKDEIGMKYAVDTRRSLMAMISRIKGAPTIEAEPVRHGRWIEETEPDENGNVTAMCNQCYHTDEHCKNIKPPYCWYCGTRMDAACTNVGGKGGTDNAGR